MKFNPPLTFGRLVKRYKRFLADVELADGTVETVHCPNSGSMLGCKRPGSLVGISRSANLKRKLPCTLEIIKIGRTWVGVNTMRPNQIASELIEHGQIPELAGYDELAREVRYGANSRVDVLLTRGSEKCYVEVKNVTLAHRGTAYFPDAVTDRGTKHLRELMAVVKQGHRAVMFFFIHRADGKIFRPADFVDPVYGDTLREAEKNGVEILAYRMRVTRERTRLSGKAGINLSRVKDTPAISD